MSADSTSLRLSAQRALLGNVPACLRSASIQKEGNKILWRCIFDAEATEDDYELASIAGAEIIADFSSPTDIEDQIVKLPSPQKMEHLSHLIFLRHENNYYNDTGGEQAMSGNAGHVE